MTRFNPLATGMALAATLATVFIVCALVQAIAPGIQASHMWLSLFTGAPIGSASAWIEGIVSSIVAGFIAGWLFGAIYNKKAAWLEKSR